MFSLEGDVARFPDNEHPFSLEGVSLEADWDLIIGKSTLKVIDTRYIKVTAYFINEFHTKIQ